MNARRGVPSSMPGARQFNFNKTSKIRNETSMYINDKILGKYFPKFINGTWSEAVTLVNDFIQKGRAKSYCDSVFRRLVAEHKRLDPKYTSPLVQDKNLISNAYQNILKIQFSKQKLFDTDGRPILQDLNLAKVVLPKIPIPKKHLYAMYIHSTFLLLSVIKYQDLLLRSISNDEQTFIELALIIYILYHTGARVNEVLSLTKKHTLGLIKEQSIYLFCKSGKLDKFIVPKLVSEMLRKYLRAIPTLEKDDTLLIRPVISKKTGKVRTRGALLVKFNQLYRRMFKAEKPIANGFHSFRKLFAFRTEDEAFAQKVMRQNKKATFQRYKQVYQGEQQFAY